MKDAQWRSMQAADLDGVVAVARTAFPDHFEGRACFAERFALYPQGCFTLASRDGAVVGYLIAYPWIAGSVPPLDTLIGALPPRPALLYLHDLALHPEAQGRGHATPVVTGLVAQAKREGWPLIALVAVNDAVSFWEGQGFAVKTDPALAEKLASYGADARYMERALAGGVPRRSD